MKKILSILLIMAVATSFGFAKKKAPPKPKKGAKPVAEKTATAVGYKVDGSKVTFMFNPNDYPQGFDEIEEYVVLAGPFQGWQCDVEDWKMKLNKSDGIWYLETTTDKIGPSGTPFKFVADAVNWQQPDPEKVPATNLVDDGYGGNNLVFIY